jgi:hypothetical protein
MHDIGLVKMFAGGRALLCVPAGMAAGYGIALLFGLPPLVGIMLGALPAFLSCFVVVDEKTSRVAARCAALYVPFTIALFVSIALREFRMVELVAIVGLLFIQFYAPRFGIWVGDFGSGLFAAFLVGLLLPLPLTSFPALALIFAASLGATVVLRSLVFHPNAYRSLMRARRAFLSWQTRLLETTIDVLDSDEADFKVLRRRRQQAHEAALITEGMLGRPTAESTGAMAEALHTLLFDTEQAVDGLARLSEELVTAGAPAEVRLAVRRAVQMILDRGGKDGHLAAQALLSWADTSPDVLRDQRWSHAVHRTALLLSDVASTSDGWFSMRKELPTSGDGIPFQSPVILAGGRPLGATPILNEEIASGGMSGPWARFRVSPALRTAIQAAVAVAIAEPLSFLLDGQRFYWGVIGVMVILAGTNSTHDRLRKVASRGIGTVIGGVIGIAFVALLGTDHVWLSLILIVVALTAGMYGFARAYVFWVIGLVVVLCQVYAYSGQFSDTLILFRLIENVMGALIAVGVSMVVLPVATGAMIRRAILRQLAAVKAFIHAASLLGSGDESAMRLRNASRAVDQATFQLEAVFKPLVRVPTGGGYRKDDQIRTVLVGVARAVRSIAYRGERLHPLSDDDARRLATISSRLDTSITELSAAVGGASARTWTSATDLIAGFDESLSPEGDGALLSYRLHALARIDEALSSLAEQYGMTVEAGQPLELDDRRAILSASWVRDRFPTA